jgi:L-methionine (R)-S-oxide reductase
MAEQLIFSSNADRAARYEQLLPQLRALIGDEPSLVANLANVAAALRQTFGFFWVGFYLVEGDQLVLGPFQGEIACTRIGFGKGVCGTAWKENRTILVPDVNAFPGHIACSSASLSEIVVPIRGRANVVAVLDVDSDTLNDFGDSDKQGLEQISELLSPLFQ